MKPSTKYFILFIVVVTIAACGRKSKNDKPVITLCETYQQEEVLPLMAQVDLLADSASTNRFIVAGKSLMTSPSDTTVINLNNYLAVSSVSPLFRKLEPNVASYRGATSPFKKSSLLGFSMDGDTAEVNHILAKSGLIRNDMVLNWVSYGSMWGNNYSALVAFHPAHKSVEIPTDDIKEVKVEQRGSSPFWKLMDSITGNSQFNVSVCLKQEALAQIRSNFNNDSLLLIRCKFRGKDLYFSATAGQIIDGIALNDTGLDNSGGKYKFSFSLL